MRRSLERVLQALVVAHRWLGIALFAPFLVWFLSGFVMLYVEMPSLLTAEQRYAALTPLEWTSQLTLGDPAAAVAASGMAGPLDRLWLEMSGGEPVWRMRYVDGSVNSLRATDGERVDAIDAATARRIASEWCTRRLPDGLSEVVAAPAETIDVDQWTLGGAYSPYRPLHRVDFEQPAGLVVYVSQRTGQVVQATTARQRFLAWLGPIPHWIYPTMLRRHARLWSGLVVWLSMLGLLLSASGLLLGLWSWWRSRRSERRWTTYRPRWLRWHHGLGLLFGVLTFTWILSGLLSMSPFGLDPRRGPSPEQRAALAGSGNSWSDFELPAAVALAAFAPSAIVELEARFSAGSAHWIGWDRTGTANILLAGDAQVPGDVQREMSGEMLRQVSRELMPSATLVDWTKLDDYDSAYLSKRASASARPLPVYRATYDDPAATRIYIDPVRGVPVLVSDQPSRLYRALYHGLHSWDFGGFYNRRPWWDLAIGFGLLGGTALATSGAVLAIRRLRSQR